MKRFLAYPWPGNVRELRNIIESMAVLATEPILDERHAEEAGFGSELAEQAPPEGAVTIAPDATLAEAERTLIEARLRQLGSRAAVAKSLGIGLRTLYSKLAASPRR
jgi:DNA-binding NtrC family response regulator